jgi:hypothetical protein
MKQSFSHKARITYIIIILYILISFITATPSNNTSSTSGNDALGGDKIPHENNSTYSDLLPRQLSGTNLHMAKFDLTVALERNQSSRGQNVILNITFENKDALRKFLTVQSIKIDLRPTFNVTRIYSNDKNDKSCQNRIRIPSFVAEKNKVHSFKYDIFIPEDAELDIKNLIDHHNFFHSTEPLDIINIRKCRVDINTSVHLKDDILIINNPPMIRYANVSINASQLIPMDNETLLVAENLSNSLNAMFNISAWDAEDGKSLKYNCLRAWNTSSGDENETIFKDFAACGDFCHELKIRPGVKYSLLLEVNDSDNEQNKTRANITYNNNIYKYILIPGETLLNYSALIITLIVTIIITIIIFRQIGYCSQKLLTRPRIVILIFITWLIYCILTWGINLTRLPFFGTYLFFNTMQLFELAVYITEFIIISSFIEACFFLEDLIDFHDRALWMNYISSLTILLIFIFIIPRIAGPLPLKEYYATMSGLMGTIFALVVTLSTQYPRNIFTSPLVKCIKSSGALNPINESADEEDLFSYPKKLRYFVMLYGASLVISLLGLVIGTNIEFSSNFVNPVQGNPYNFLSVALFETTILLIPPTVISLYHLMEVVSFRGKITIKSEPSGAMVFLSKMHEKRSSSVYRAAQSILDHFFAQDQEQACVIEQPHCLNLLTPCTLMLMRGTYNLKLKKDDVEMEPYPIKISDAVESELTINLAAKK